MGAVIDDARGRASASGRAASPWPGFGFGGYFAARAAAFDDRIGALVLDSPRRGPLPLSRGAVGPAAFRMRQDIRPEDVAGIPEDLLPQQMLWGIFAVCRRFGVAIAPSLEGAPATTTAWGGAGVDRCPVLGLVGEREGREVLDQADGWWPGCAAR